MRIESRRSVVSALLGVLIAGTAAASPARAGISFVDMFRNEAFVQTGNGNTLAANGSFLAMRLTSTGPNDYTSVKTTYPGPASPVTLSPVNPTLFSYVSPSSPARRR